MVKRHDEKSVPSPHARRAHGGKSVKLPGQLVRPQVPLRGRKPLESTLMKVEGMVTILWVEPMGSQVLQEPALVWAPTDAVHRLNGTR